MQAACLNCNNAMLRGLGYVRVGCVMTLGILFIARPDARCQYSCSTACVTVPQAQPVHVRVCDHSTHTISELHIRLSFHYWNIAARLAHVFVTVSSLAVAMGLRFNKVIALSD